MWIDPDESRRKAFKGLEESGDAQAAIWSVIEALQAQGIDIGAEGAALLETRKKIKERRPKP